MYAIRSYYELAVICSAVVLLGVFWYLRLSDSGHTLPQGNFRITSYNVCYTKLLREQKALSARAKKSIPSADAGKVPLIEELIRMISTF